MSQWSWTYYDPNQGTQTVGLYHGDQSGHLMVYLNREVVIVDFKVHQSKSYSFMVNENLIKLNLDKSNGKFLYNLEKTNPKVELTTLDRVKRFIRSSFLS